MSVLVHLGTHMGRRAWFMPDVKDECRIPVDGKSVVTRTIDGGRSFSALPKGLPAEMSYDIVYRHGMDIDASGQRIVMGSTTRSAWITEDGGEQWERLSAHLPPIRTVRYSEA
jgi:hypothetical protein